MSRLPEEFWYCLGAGWIILCVAAAAIGLLWEANRYSNNQPQNRCAESHGQWIIQQNVWDSNGPNYYCNYGSKK